MDLDGRRLLIGSVFELSEPKAVTPDTSIQGNEVARGDYWSVQSHDGRYVLSYISGELTGREKELTIIAEEAAALANETGSVEEILLAHGAG